MIEKSIITASSFSYDNRDYTRINLEVITPGCGIPRNMAVLTYDPDLVADASENYSAYTMRCQLAGVEPGLDATQFAVYKFLSSSKK